MNRLLIVSVQVLVLAAASGKCLAQVGMEVELPSVTDGWTPDGLSPVAVQSVAKSDPMLWRQYQALGSGGASGTCSGCGSTRDRCGCTKLFPWTNGPGRCDSWCVGPKWQVQLDGLAWTRDDADWAPVTAAVGVAQTFETPFEHGPGQRVVFTGYNSQGYGMQVVYEGINEWTSRSEYDLGGGNRSLTNDATLHSVEINFLSKTPDAWALFGGVRYIEMADDLRDLTIVDKAVPAPADPPAASVAYVDSSTDYLLKNRLIGFQVGARRDSWRWNKWLSIEGFANAGVYANRFKREDVDRSITTVYTGDDLATPEVEFNESVTEVSNVTRREATPVAFFGEAAASCVWRVNRCVALRGGYQVAVADNVGQALDAFSLPGFASSTQLYHGWQFGLEYRR